MNPERREYLEAVMQFHEPNTPPSTCMWCGLPSPCPPYLEAHARLLPNHPSQRKP